MDVLKNRGSRQLNIKRFTINAIVSAILTLNVEIASASTCPSHITGTSLAGIICEFNAGSSIVVENGGNVGGITMNSYNPLPPSQIMINAGGIVSNTSVGISISSSSLSNGLINNGTISTGSTGILVSNSTIGGISNSGTILSSNGTGIRILSTSTISGGITNNGTIIGGGVDEGITVLGNNIINGDISNRGLIQSNTGNGIVINFSNIINGNISNSGTIHAGNTGISLRILDTVNGNISNSGLIEAANGIRVGEGTTIHNNIYNSGLINASNLGISVRSSSIEGGISNSGTIRGGNSGIAVTSSSTISGGISNSGIIQGDNNAIFIDSSSHVNQIDILGQNARIIGAVDAVNTTFNITSGAKFSSEGTFNVNSFNIASNAIFNMANAITVQNAVTNAGILAIGNKTQTITGNYTQSSGGIFQIEASSATNYGKLQVSNTANLSQSGNINVQVTQNSLFHAGDVLSNVISGDTLIAPTDGFNVTDNSFIWEFIATDPNNTGVNLTATINPAVYEACHGDYCQGAATTIIEQVSAGNPLFSPYTTLATENEFETAASQATPELTNENIQVTQLVTRSVMDIVPMWSTLHGKSAGDAMIYQPGKIWLKPYGGSMTQNESNTVDGFNAQVYGVVIGKDIQLTEDWLFGGALSAGKDNVDGKSTLNGQSIDSDVYQAMLYGSKKLPYNIYLAGQALIGYGDNDTKRLIPLYSSTAEGSYDSWFTNLRAQLGWNIYPLENLVFTPELDASYFFINQKSYQESGSPMDLSIDSNNNSSLVLGVYGNGAYRVTTLSNQYDLALTGYAGIARNVLNSQPETTATFLAGGESFSTFGVQFNELVFRGGVGLTIANPTKPLRVNLNYDLQTGNEAHSGVGAVNIIYQL